MKLQVVCTILHVFVITVSATLHLEVFNNTALAEPAATSRTIDTLDVTFPSLGPLSAEITGTFSPVGATNLTTWDFTCDFTGFTSLYVWIDDHMVCQFGAYNNSVNGIMDGASFTLGNKRSGLPVRVHMYGSGGSPASLSVLWSGVPIPASVFGTTLPGPEVSRRLLQRTSMARWGSWLHRDALSHVLLPDSAVVAVQLCRLDTGWCLAGTQIDGNGGLNTPRVRVGAHSINHSYSQLFVAFHGLNVSVEYAVGSSNPRDLDLLVTPVTGPTTEYVVVFTGRFAWGRKGEFHAHPEVNGLHFHGVGLQDVFLYSSSPELNITFPVYPPGMPAGSHCTHSRDCSSEDCAAGVCTAATPLVAYAVSLVGGGPVGLTTVSSGRDITSITRRITAQRTADAQSYSRFGAALSVATEAITAALGWRNIYVPAEYGPVMPMTFGFSWISPEPSTYDYAYVLFCWDNILASYTAGVLGFKDAAYSNLIQIIKAKSNDGYVPNWYSGGSKAVQAEPSLGSKVLLDLYERFGDVWLVDLLFDDLYDWNTWQWNRRRVGVTSSSVGWVTLGNDYSTCVSASDCVGSYKGESGLDQSPMWDCPGADPTGNGGNCSGLARNGSRVLQLADVQSTSLFVQDAQALARLAKVLGINRSRELNVLTGRATAMKSQLSLLWDPDQTAFVNMFTESGTFSRHVSPTSFYPLLVGAATEAQGLAMIDALLLNESVFCVSAATKDPGDACYWGLPSISRSDAAYMQPLDYVYWRGLSWGPMSLLTWWALHEYAASPRIAAAASALATQKTAMMVDMWNRNRHICENYSPYGPNSTLVPGTNNGVNKTNTECTGWEMYAWGALHGLISILETEK